MTNLILLSFTLSFTFNCLLYQITYLSKMTIQYIQYIIYK